MSTPTHTPPPHGRPPVPHDQRITAEAADTLASALQLIRPDWHHTGIYKALEQNCPYAHRLDLAHALITAARIPANKTPAVINYPGPHWTAITPTGTIASAPPAQCPIPEHARIGRLQVNCPECRKMRDFPERVDRAVYERLDPSVRAAIDERPYVEVVG